MIGSLNPVVWFSTLNTGAPKTSLITFHDLSSVLCLDLVQQSQYSNCGYLPSNNFFNVAHMVLTAPFQTKRTPGWRELGSTRAEGSSSVLSDRSQWWRPGFWLGQLGGRYFHQLSGQAVAAAGGRVLDGECRGKWRRGESRACEVRLEWSSWMENKTHNP